MGGASGGLSKGGRGTRGENVPRSSPARDAGTVGIQSSWDSRLVGGQGRESREKVRLGKNTAARATGRRGSQHSPISAPMRHHSEPRLDDNGLHRLEGLEGFRHLPNISHSTGLTTPPPPTTGLDTA